MSPKVPHHWGYPCRDPQTAQPQSVDPGAGEGPGPRARLVCGSPGSGLSAGGREGRAQQQGEGKPGSSAPKPGGLSLGARRCEPQLRLPVLLHGTPHGPPLSSADSSFSHPLSLPMAHTDFSSLGHLRVPCDKKCMLCDPVRCRP